MTSPARHPSLVPAVGFTFVACALVVGLGFGPAYRSGDGWEYLVTLEAITRHGSFDVQEEDFVAALAHARYEGYEQQLANHEMRTAGGYRTAPNGQRLSLHFWGYPLVAVPAKFALRVCGGQELNALRVTNGVFYLLGVGALLLGSAGPQKRQAAVAALAGFGPVAWYLPFTGAEVFSFGLAAAAVAAYSRQRYALAALAAGLAATQNPPLVLLAGVCILAALWKRNWRQAGWAAGGTLVAFVPAAFYFITFGKPSLIDAEYVNPRLIGWDRTVSLLLDLNQGLLPYLPVVAVALPVAAVRLLWARNVADVLLFLALVGVTLGVQVQTNWNSDCRGLMRYWVWMLPLAVGVVGEGLPLKWLARAGVAGTIASALVLATCHPYSWSYSAQTPQARWVLEHAPWAYHPEHEIFCERQTHIEPVRMSAADDPKAGKVVGPPLAFGREDGTVTKLLVSRECVGRLAERFVISPDYLPTLLAECERCEKPGYVHPPAGAVRAKPGTIHGTPNADPWLDPGVHDWVREQK